jgi:hypothetical protein
MSYIRFKVLIDFHEILLQAVRNHSLSTVTDGFFTSPPGVRASSLFRSQSLYSY